MGNCGTADRCGGPLYVHRHHANKQDVTRTGSRARCSRDSHFARALGEAPRGENGAQLSRDSHVCLSRTLIPTAGSRPVLITSRSALAGSATAVGISLCAWGVIALMKSGQFADGHFALVWVAAVLLHIISFSIPATLIWLGLRNRAPRTCSVLVGVWCLCYLAFLFIFLPASAGP